MAQSRLMTGSSSHADQSTNVDVVIAPSPPWIYSVCTYSTVVAVVMKVLKTQLLTLDIHLLEKLAFKDSVLKRYDKSGLIQMVAVVLPEIRSESSNHEIFFRVELLKADSCPAGVVLLGGEVIGVAV